MGTPLCDRPCRRPSARIACPVSVTSSYLGVSVSNALCRSAQALLIPSWPPIGPTWSTLIRPGAHSPSGSKHATHPSMSPRFQASIARMNAATSSSDIDQVSRSAGELAGVEGLGRLADALAASWAQRLACVEPHAAGGAARNHGRGQGPEEVRKGEQGAQHEGPGPPHVLAQVEIAVAVVLDRAALGSAKVARHLVVVDGARRGDVESAPAGLGEAAAEVGL